MSFELTEDQKMMQKIARDFAEKEVAPGAEERDEHESFSRPLYDAMAGLGLTGICFPEQYGGADGDVLSYILAIEEISKADAGLGIALSATVSLCAWPIFAYGTEEQKQKYLPRLASGEIIGSFCLTEPESGSDAASLRTTAIKDGDNYVLNGTKRYITNAPQAGIFTVMARTDPDNKRSGGISAFIVESDTPGITLGKIDKKMGQKGAHTCDVIFDNCVVPASALIGGVEGVGFKTAMKVLDKGRLHIAAASTGAATRMLDDALRYAVERKQFGQPIANFQLIQAMLADSKAEIYAAKSMVLDASRLRDEGKDVVTESSCAKMFATEMCGRVADRAVQIHGGAGYIADYGIERFYRDVRLYRLYEGTTQIQQIIIARNMIKEVSE